MAIKISRDAVELKQILTVHDELMASEFDKNRFYHNLKLLTKKTNDEYLNTRAEKFLNDVDNDIVLYELIGRLNYDDIVNSYILKYFNAWCIEQQDSNNEGFNFIDLFCGSGGLSLGFIQEGFKVNCACDIEPACIETYRFNHPTVNSKFILNEDIKILESNINDYLQYKNVDLVIGGPPCQGFSIANQQRIIDDPRNQLYKSFVNVVALTHPKLFVMENVKGMLKVADQVKEDFERIGYKVHYKILNAQDFSVPQNRERLIFIGTRNNIEPSLLFSRIESMSHESYTLKDAIGDLNKLEASRLKNTTDLINETNGGIAIKYRPKIAFSEYVKKINQGHSVSRVIFNHQARYNNDRDIEIFGRMNPGDKSDDPKIQDIMPYKSRSHIFKDKYYKLKYEDVCKTITAHMRFDCNMYIHPTEARGLTPREAARIQSYPDDYIFKGVFTKTYMQVGNSVPPLMGRAIAKVIKSILKET